MDRIKDWSKLKYGREGMVTVEIIPKVKSLIIMPDDAKDNAVTWDYAKVIAVGNKVGDIEVGDIILNYDGGTSVYEVEDKKYANLIAHMCTIVVSPDNFKFKE